MKNKKKAEDGEEDENKGDGEDDDNKEDEDKNHMDEDEINEKEKIKQNLKNSSKIYYSITHTV
jgi:hypothetical protein